MEGVLPLWQSPAWKSYQESLGREVLCHGSGAQIVIDQTKFGLTTWDVPRGPVFDSAISKEDQEEIVELLIQESKSSGALSITFSPEKPLDALDRLSKPSRRHIYPEATRIIDLTKDEEDILAQMKQKGRYNIRLAEKSGVQPSLKLRSASSCQRSEDASYFFELMKSTSVRDRFRSHSREHYAKFLDLPDSFLLIAFKDQEPIAGLIGVIHGDTGIYYYGASSYEHRSLMAPYLLQWEAIKYCKSKGCTSYDLFGIAPPGSTPDHPWQGITSFKEKFGGQLITYPQERIVVHRPFLSLLLRFWRWTR